VVRVHPTPRPPGRAAQPGDVLAHAGLLASPVLTFVRLCGCAAGPPRGTAEPRKARNGAVSRPPLRAGDQKPGSGATFFFGVEAGGVAPERSRMMNCTRRFRARIWGVTFGTIGFSWP